MEQTFINARVYNIGIFLVKIILVYIYRVEEQRDREGKCFLQNGKRDQKINWPVSRRPL